MKTIATGLKNQERKQNGKEKLNFVSPLRVFRSVSFSSLIDKKSGQ